MLYAAAEAPEALHDSSLLLSFGDAAVVLLAACCFTRARLYAARCWLQEALRSFRRYDLPRRVRGASAEDFFYMLLIFLFARVSSLLLIFSSQRVFPYLETW